MPHPFYHWCIQTTYPLPSPPMFFLRSDPMQIGALAVSFLHLFLQKALSKKTPTVCMRRTDRQGKSCPSFLTPLLATSPFAPYLPFHPPRQYCPDLLSMGPSTTAQQCQCQKHPLPYNNNRKRNTCLLFPSSTEIQKRTEGIFFSASCMVIPT